MILKQTVRLQTSVAISSSQTIVSYPYSAYEGRYGYVQASNEKFKT